MAEILTIKPVENRKNPHDLCITNTGKKDTKHNKNNRGEPN
jgi:hypothetical protein